MSCFSPNQASVCLVLFKQTDNSNFKIFITKIVIVHILVQLSWVKCDIIFEHHDAINEVHVENSDLEIDIVDYKLQHEHVCMFLQQLQNRTKTISQSAFSGCKLKSLDKQLNAMLQISEELTKLNSSSMETKTTSRKGMFGV